MADAAEQQLGIIVTAVLDDARPRFLYEKLGGACVAFEQMCFNAANDYAVGYAGGLWGFYTLSNGGFYIAPPHSANKNGAYPFVVDTNGYSGVLSSDAAGVAISLFALNRLMWLHGVSDEQLRLFDALYYKLYDLAAQHAEGSEIFGAID